MIFPKGEVVHRNLLTAYTDVSALLSTLKSEGFSGTIEIEFPESRGIFFIDSGEVIHAEAKMESGQKRLIGQEAVQELLTLSDQKNGVLNIYRLSSEQVNLVASTLQSEILLKGLSTVFTRLDKLILKLREEKYHGFIEIFTKEDQAVGVLFLKEGDPVEMYVTSEPSPSFLGKKSIPPFLEKIVKQGAIFNLYRSYGPGTLPKAVVVEEGKDVKVGKEAFTQGADDLKELIPILQEVLYKAEKFVDAVSRKGTFIRVFKKSLIEKADEYPFLDPFGGEFEYREGEILFTGEAGVKEFTKGIGECVNVTLFHLKKEFPKDKMLLLKLRAGIESSFEHHQEKMKQLGLDSVLSSFFE
jgi:hypothetical protein